MSMEFLIQHMKSRVTFCSSVFFQEFGRHFLPNLEWNIAEIEDLTRLVISYEIFETSLRRV